MVKIVLTIIISYLIGSISPSILIGRARGIDIKKEGSGNAGTTNALRVLGAKAAVITLVVDILKGLLPAILFPLIFGMPELCYWSSLAAFVGHLFPVYYGFKGGKGVAVAFGGLLGVNWKLALLCLLTVVIVTLLTKRMSAGSISGAALAVVYAIFLEKGFLPFIIIMAALIIFMHRGNIKRLINGVEPPLGFLAGKEKTK